MKRLSSPARWSARRVWNGMTVLKVKPSGSPLRGATPKETAVATEMPLSRTALKAPASLRVAMPAAWQRPSAADAGAAARAAMPAAAAIEAAIRVRVLLMGSSWVRGPTSSSDRWEHVKGLSSVCRRPVQPWTIPPCRSLGGGLEVDRCGRPTALDQRSGGLTAYRDGHGVAQG